MNGTILDVIIVGGGPAGCAAALSLSKYNEGSSFIIIDDADQSAFKVGESLPPESSRLLQHLHPPLPSRLAQEVASGIHLHCTGNASAWASSILEERHAIMNPFGHGFHLDRAAFDELLRRSVIDSQHTMKASQTNPCMVKGRFKTVEKDSASNWAVHVDVDGETMTFIAKWVIDATGRKASLATKLGARIITSDPLLAFYAVFANPSNADNDNRTVIEATPDGWFYSALLSHTPSKRIVAFHTLPTHPSAKRARRREGFLDLVQESTSNISAIIERNDYEMMPSVFPRCTAAGSSHLDKACDSEDKWVAVGDAAMAFDPLSSQGIMTALEMGYYVGMVLERRTSNDNLKAEASAEIEEMYRKVRTEYQQKRAYYYGLVKRFQGEEFWNIVNHI